MKPRYFLSHMTAGLGLAVGLSTLALAQQPLPYDMVDLGNRAPERTDCKIFSSSNHQHVWIGCNTSGVYINLFRVSSDGHLGKKIEIDLTSLDWGIKEADQLISVSDSPQLIFLNLKTSEMVLLPTLFIHKGDSPAESSNAIRQPIPKLDDFFAKNSDPLWIQNLAIVNQDTFLVLLKTISEPDQIWLLRLQNKGQQQTVEDITPAAAARVDHYNMPTPSKQDLIVNKQGFAMLYDQSEEVEESESGSLYCFNMNAIIVTNQVITGDFFSPILTKLPNGNFVVASYHYEDSQFQAYRTVLTPGCKLVERGAWDLKPGNEVKAVNVSPQGDVFLVYEDGNNSDKLAREDAGEDSYNAPLYVAKISKDNKLAWTKPLIEKNDPWYPYINLYLPFHADDSVKYDVQINFSSDGKQVLVMVYNRYQSKLAKEVLAKGPKNLLPRVYRVPVN